MSRFFNLLDLHYLSLIWIVMIFLEVESTQKKTQKLSWFRYWPLLRFVIFKVLCTEIWNPRLIIFSKLLKYFDWQWLGISYWMHLPQQLNELWEHCVKTSPSRGLFTVFPYLSPHQTTGNSFRNCMCFWFEIRCKADP